MCHQEPCHVKVILGPSQEIALTGTVGVFSVLAGKPLNEEVVGESEVVGEGERRGSGMSESNKRKTFYYSIS